MIEKKKKKGYLTLGKLRICAAVSEFMTLVQPED